MPLIKRASKEALQKNIKTEMDANPSKDKHAQNLAIAYNIQKQAMKKKKMARGGQIDTHEDEKEHMQNQREADRLHEAEKPRMADGGLLFADEDLYDKQDKLESAKRRSEDPKMMADGGLLFDDEDEHMKEKMRAERLMDYERPGRAYDKHVAEDMEGMIPRKAKGGMLYEDEDEHMREKMEAEKLMEYERPGRPYKEHVAEIMGDMIPRKAKGGMLFEDEDNYDEEMKQAEELHSYEKPGHSLDDESMIDAIIRKRSSKYMADGGEVDISRNADEDANKEDQLSYQALKKENYSESDALMDQPEDSNLMGHDLSDEDSHDHVEEMRKKIKYKRGY